MIPFDNEPPEVELGDPPAAKADRRPRWTIGRVANDLLIAVFVSIPIVNLATPLFGMALMVHVHKRLTSPRGALFESAR